MKYMLLIYGNHESWDGWSAEEYEAIVRIHADVHKELTESGELVGSEGLTTLNAKTVRVHNGVPAITDGPFTEAKEYLAGYYMVDCASLERATEIAARLPEAQYAPVEVRQFMGKDHMQR
jgi:hypothetical protein